MNEKLYNKVNNLLQEDKQSELRSYLTKLKPYSIVRIINETPYKKKIFLLLPPDIQANIILGLSDNTKEAIIKSLSSDDLARMLHFNQSDNATDLLQILPNTRQQKILSKISSEERKKIEKLLKYGKETAGGLMDLNFIILKSTVTFDEIAKSVQGYITKEKIVPLVLLEDEKKIIVGSIPYINLIQNPPGTPALKLTQPLALIPHTRDQEKIVEIMQEMQTETVGVVDEQHNVIGVIHSRDLLNVVEDEATEDLYGFAGVSKEESVLDSAMTKVKFRYKWLIINLATAFLASSVVGLFADTISRFTLLAVYMPIVAGMGGNAGTQALAVAVRGLVLQEVELKTGRQLIINEMLAGLTNGAINGLLVAIIAVFINHSPKLGIVISIAMVINLIVAGFFGALVPMVMKVLGKDPASSATIFITTATDVIGFFVFLGLASVIL